MLYPRIIEGIHGERHRFSGSVRAGLVALFLNSILMTGTIAAEPATTGGADSDPDVDDMGDQQVVSAVGLINTNDEAMSKLTTADAVLRLSPEEAQRGYPVDIRGVVTCVVQEHNAFIIQDTTHAVFVVNAPATALPARGEL